MYPYKRKFVGVVKSEPAQFPWHQLTWPNLKFPWVFVVTVVSI